MDLDLIKKLVKIVDSSGVTELEIQEGELKVKIAKKFKTNNVFVPSANSPIITEAVPSVKTEVAVKEKSEEPKPSNNYEIKSPIVGTFYRAPAPDADPYIQIGDIVSKGTVLCIVEAMKLMNEIESDAEGKVVKILVENGKPVEYNQPLFLIEPV